MELGTTYHPELPEIVKFLKTKIQIGDKICDVGPGNGTYYNAIGKDYYWIGVEIWHNAVEYLKDKYDKVYEEDIRNFEYPEDYDLIIFGDVLEHLTVEDAQAVLKEAKLHSKAILVAVPYNYEQGPLYGNNAEYHLQPDLTFEIFNKRYPNFDLIWGSNSNGYFYWERKILNEE
jgi:hypothetical protein